MITESFTLKGELDIKVLDSSYALKEERKVKNLVVASGKNYIASRMTSNANIIMNHMAVGTANIATSTGQTGLLGESGRVGLDSTSITNNTITYIATFGAGVATGSLHEAAIFNNSSANTGTMLCRTNFNSVNKGAGDIVVITWNITVE